MLDNSLGLDFKLILRFDDTDTTVKPPMMSAYDSIPKQQEWLCGFPAHRIVIASERMEFYHEMRKAGYETELIFKALKGKF